MIDKSTIVAQIESHIKREVETLEAKIDAKLNELKLPCSVHIGKTSPAVMEAIMALYEGKGKWTVEVYEEQNETITLSFS